MTKPVTIQLTEAQEDHLRSVSEQPGNSIDVLLAEFVAKQIDYDAWFRSEVQKGIDAADRGELIDHEEFVARRQRLRDELTGKAGTR